MKNAYIDFCKQKTIHVNTYKEFCDYGKKHSVCVGYDGKTGRYKMFCDYDYDNEQMEVRNLNTNSEEFIASLLYPPIVLD